MTTLRALREAAGLTAQHLASRMLEPVERVVAWEGGEAVPSNSQQRQLALSLQVPPATVRAAVAATRAQVVAAGLAEDAGVQRLIDAWRRATVAERNAFLWLAAEEIQAAADGELLNELTHPQARGHGPERVEDLAEGEREDPFAVAADIELNKEGPA
jgi:transcriptional regulator with XRE-family HTH domain